MGRKIILKIGDRVMPKDEPDVIGVIVHKHQESNLLKNGRIWSVHWYNPNSNMRSRGIYSNNELIKDKSKEKNDNFIESQTDE